MSRCSGRPSPGAGLPSRSMRSCSPPSLDRFGSRCSGAERWAWPVWRPLWLFDDGGRMRDSLIYDWNVVEPASRPPVVMFDDETLRDGLQSPSVRSPSIDQRIQILHLIEA